MVSETQKYYLAESLNLYLRRFQTLHVLKRNVFVMMAFFGGLAVGFALSFMTVLAIICAVIFVVMMILSIVLSHKTKHDIEDSVQDFYENVEGALA